MAKTGTISARIDPETKANAEKVFEELGLTTSQAITLFYKQVELRHGLPFAVALPNATTRKALDEAEQRAQLPRFESTDTLFEDLGI